MHQDLVVYFFAGFPDQNHWESNLRYVLYGPIIGQDVNHPHFVTPNVLIEKRMYPTVA